MYHYSVRSVGNAPEFHLQVARFLIELLCPLDPKKQPRACQQSRAESQSPIYKHHPSFRKVHPLGADKQPRAGQ